MFLFALTMDQLKKWANEPVHNFTLMFVIILSIDSKIFLNNVVLSAILFSEALLAPVLGIWKIRKYRLFVYPYKFYMSILARVIREHVCRNLQNRALFADINFF